MKLTKEATIASQLDKIAAQRDELVAKIKEYEKLLKEQPQYLEKISTPIYQISIDLKKIIYINPAARKLMKFSSKELYQNPDLWFQSIHEKDRSTVFRALQNMAKNRESEILLEYRIKKNDKTYLYVTNRATLIYDSQGNPIYIMGFIHDTSELFTAKKEMLLYDQIMNVAHTEKSIEVAIEAILRISCLSFEWDEGEVWLIEQSTDSLYCIKIWHNLHDEIKEFYEKSYQLKINLNEGFQGEVIRNNLPTLVTDYSKHKQYIRGVSAQKAGLKTVFGLPITHQGKILGVLIYFSKHVKKLTHRQISIAEKISAILADIIQNKCNKDQILYITHHDNLTGLINRLALEEFLKTEINKNNKLIALIMMDFDRFKKINEFMGLDVGDTVIKHMASKFSECLFETCASIANLGGDQFVFVLKDMKRVEEIPPLIERIKSIVKTPLMIKGKNILLTMSVGVGIYPYDGKEVLSLLKNTSIALNHAKSRGGNCVQYFSEILQKTATKTIEVEDNLRRGLVENDFRLYYQPRVDLKSGQIIGVEALLRWQSPKEGLLLPNTFIPVAEQSDLIVYIGKWVLLEVCRHFPFEHLNIPVSINFSARQFQIQYDIVKVITLILEKLSLQPNLLEIEVTESQLMSDPVRSSKVLGSLRKLGLSIAIDDFGTGYSSFQYLKQFKPNRIKIDKSFIDGLPADCENAGIVKAIIALCRSLEIKVTAEGVENADQLRFLMDEGCDEMQGFYFSKPLPIYDLIYLIDSKKKLTLQ